MVDIELQLRFGRAKITLLDDAVVDLDDLRTVWKLPIYEPPQRANSSGPRIRISGTMEFGRLTIRHKLLTIATQHSARAAEREKGVGVRRIQLLPRSTYRQARGESVNGADPGQTRRSTSMKVMVLGKADGVSESGEFGTAEEFAAMDQSQRESPLRRARCWPPTGSSRPAKGKWVAFDADGNTMVIDGLFAETKELVAGFSIWEVASMDEAVGVAQAPAAARHRGRTPKGPRR